MDSKNHFLNRSVENNILNFSGHEFNINDDKQNQNKNIDSYDRVNNI